MKKRLLTIFCSALILCTMLTGCRGNMSSGSGADLGSAKQTLPTENADHNMMSGITARDVNVENTPSETQTVTITDFSLRLLQSSLQENENTLISPLSVIYALGMTANGADGETLAQMEETFGLSTEEVNRYLYTYNHSLPQGDQYQLRLANAIWFCDREDLVFEVDFLQTNADWYGAGLYKAPFDDSTLREINDWVEVNTDGLIRDILDEIRDDAVMYLVNALAFDAEWETIYKEYQIYGGIFTSADGNGQEAEMMHSEESCYLEDEYATGFVKYYADRSYAFAALLPNEGVSLEEYTAFLNGERLNKLFADAQTITVYAAIPKFECEYDLEMSQVLQAMGMTDAFDDVLADFSRMGHSARGNIHINRILHKTYIAVDERGTKAGASTVVEMTDESAPMNTKTVHLDRPFLYMLIDCEENLPIFIGTLNYLDQ